MPAPKKKAAKKTTPAKRPAKKAASSGRKGGRPSAMREQAKKTQKTRARKARPDEIPSGRRLTAAQQNLRDTRMIQRLAQGWTWAAISQEAGISVTSAMDAVKARQEHAPIRLNMDPVEVIEKIAEGYQLSIGDLESIAAEAALKNNFAVAVGAKKGANDAREKLLVLFQVTGRLPQELSALRHLIDIRAVAVRMLDVMDDFERDMALAFGLESEEERREVARAAADKVRTTFAQLMGMEEAVEGTAKELPAGDPA